MPLIFYNILCVCVCACVLVCVHACVCVLYYTVTATCKIIPNTPFFSSQYHVIPQYAILYAPCILPHRSQLINIHISSTTPEHLDISTIAWSVKKTHKN